MTDPDDEAFIQSGITKTLNFDYLTPESDPVTVDVTTFMPPGTRLENVSPRTVIESLIAVFGLPFREVPRAPLTIPTHRVPPSRRKKLEEKARRAEGAYQGSRRRRKR